MIKLMFLSYLDRKKLMVVFIFELLVILFVTLIIYEKDATLDMMLHPNYYLTYINQVFIQVFLIINAMFTLFLVMDHDQSFLKPMISFFGRFKVSFYKYVFFIMILMVYSCFVQMIYIIVMKLLTPLEMRFDIYMLIYMYLDMFILLNMILIFIKQKYKSLSIIIIMIYIFQTLFNDTLFYAYHYVFPLYQLNKSYHFLELYYKLCYICLGFMVYLLKSSYCEL